jgi:hypothetical protein
MDWGHVDAAEPPHIVVEGPERCADGAGVEELLRRSLAHAKAPGPAWVVTMHIALFQGSAHGLSAQGDITDGAGVNVAHRFLSGSSPHCGALARALGVWAALVLDAELARASAQTPASAQPAPAAGPPATPERADAQRPDVVVERPLLEHDAALSHDERAGLEIGLGGFIMAETAGRPFAGVSPYVVVDAGHGLFLRPAIAVGDSLPQAGPSAQWLAGRFDACVRWRGLYANGHGLDFTFCGGGEGGFTHDSGVSSAAPGAAPAKPPNAAYVAFGPGIDLRGELAESVSAILRGVGGADILPAGWSARFELALSWRMP